MMAHELLRQAALILADGWSHNANARDATGRIVPKRPEGIFLSEYERGDIGVGKARMSQCCKSPPASAFGAGRPAATSSDVS